MNIEQTWSLTILAGGIVLFASGKLRYDFVSLGALAISLLTGVVKPQHAFSGFASDVVVIIASALIVSAAVARSHIVEPLVQPLIRRLTRPATQVPALATATALLAMVTKNVGALATLMPVAIRMGRTKESSPSALLMPMSFMSLMGGLVTLVGTSTNIIVSDVRARTFGQPFRMFDFAPVGLALTALGLAYVSVGWRLLPRERRAKAELGAVAARTRYVTEASVPSDWPVETLGSVDTLHLGNTGVRLLAIIGPGGENVAPMPDARLSPGTVLVIEGDDQTLGALFARLPLQSIRQRHVLPTEEDSEEIRVVEAVVQRNSALVGRTAASIALQHRYGAKLLAIGRSGNEVAHRLAHEPLQPGDMLVLQSGEAALSTALTDLHLLPLAERQVLLGNRRSRYGPGIILAAAIILIATQAVPVALGFFVAALAVVAIGSLTMREAYGALEPEVLVLIGALTPIAQALEQNGTTALIGHALAGLLSQASPLIILGGLLTAAMLCAPFLHNAPTVLVMAPIGVTLARQLGLNPDAFLMAIATGAGCDFLTPVGHQCNTLVRGPGGYKFGDYWKLGLPLSIIVIVVGTPLIARIWHL